MCMKTKDDDIELIKSILQGNQPAFGILVSKYESYVFTLVMRIINNREVAEELSQDVFVKAYRFLADFNGACKFSTWLYTIVNSTCLSYLRKKKDDTILLEQEKMIAIADSVEKPTDKMEQTTQKQMINKAMELLPAIDAQVLRLFYIAEQSLDEIGVITGMTSGNVKVKLFRARQKLRDIFKEKYSKEMVF